MSRPDVTKLLADNWHSLPHEDGRPRRLMHFSQFGADEDTKRRVQILGHDLGDCVQTLLERGGYTISHKDDPKPADAEGYKTARLTCRDCGKELYTFGVGADMVASIGSLAQRSLRHLDEHDCKP